MVYVRIRWKKKKKDEGWKEIIEDEEKKKKVEEEKEEGEKGPTFCEGFEMNEPNASLFAYSAAVLTGISLGTVVSS